MKLHWQFEALLPRGSGTNSVYKSNCLKKGVLWCYISYLCYLSWKRKVNNRSCCNKSRTIAKVKEKSDFETQEQSRRIQDWIEFGNTEGRSRKGGET